MKYVRRHINEDFIDSYDSSIQDDTIYDVMKKSSEDYVIDCLNKMFNYDAYESDFVNGLKQYLLSFEWLRSELDSKSIISIHEEKFSITHIINKTQRVFFAFYAYARYAIDHYKQEKEFDSVQKIIDRIQERIDCVFIEIHNIFLYHMFKDNIVESTYLAYVKAIQDDLTMPMMAELAELKKRL